MSTSPERYAAIKDIALRARELPPGEREAFLGEACGDDRALRSEVEELLGHDRDDSSMLRTAGVARGLTTHLAAELGAAGGNHPESIGPYRILGVLGAGGMGVVYRAEQTEPIHRTVALKQIRLGMDTERVIARFEAERRTLALMEHPFIARVLDAGAGENGRPYFVLELVEGVPVTEFCRAGTLSVEDRVALFLDVLSAVQHAHRKGVIHRDLKPSNILVSRVDGRATPKVIDFGIAKAVEESQASSGAITLEGQLLGTPDYMSPEQAEMQPGVDTRSDIYALGVVLYEMLTGNLPLSRAVLAASGPRDAARILATEDPPPPSDRTREAANLAGYPAPELAGLRNRLRGDLDAIALRALERDPARRYQTADAFAADLRRHLDHQPVLAARADTAYRVRKFVRRHRGVVTAAALLAVALTAGAVGTAWQAVRATREREVAQERLAAVRELANSFVFEVDDRARDLAGSAALREYIAVTGARLLADMADDPETGRELRDVLAGSFYRLGDVQTEVGQTAEALDSYRRAIDFAEAGLRERPGDARLLAVLGEASDHAGRALTRSGRTAEAAGSHERAAEIFARLAEAHPDSTEYRANLARSLSIAGFTRVRLGEAERAAELHRRAIAEREAIAAERPGDLDAAIELATARVYLGETLEDLGAPEEALARYRSGAEGFEDALRRDPTNNKAMNRLAVTLGALGAVHSGQGRSGEAIPILERSLELRREYARLNPEVVRSQRDVSMGLLQLGDAQAETGDVEAARRAYVEGEAICRSISERDPEDTVSPRYQVVLGHALARLDIGARRWDEAQRRLLALGDINDGLRRREPEREDHATHQAENFALTGTLHEGMAESAGSGARIEHLRAARTAYAAGVETLRELRARDMLPPKNEPWLADLEADVARCDSLLAAGGAE